MKERRVRKYHYTIDWNVISCEESSDPWWKLAPIYIRWKITFLMYLNTFFSYGRIHLLCILPCRIHVSCISLSVSAGYMPFVSCYAGYLFFIVPPRNTLRIRHWRRPCLRTSLFPLWLVWSFTFICFPSLPDTCLWYPPMPDTSFLHLLSAAFHVSGIDGYNSIVSISSRLFPSFPVHDFPSVRHGRIHPLRILPCRIPVFRACSRQRSTFPALTDTYPPYQAMPDTIPLYISLPAVA